MKTDVVFKPTAKQFKAHELLVADWARDIVEILFGGGAGGGKSWLGCFWITSSALQYPGSRWFIGRRTLQDLKKSTLNTLYDVFRFFGMKSGIDYKHNQQDNKITFIDPSNPDNQSEIYLLDLSYKPSDPDYEDLGSTEYTGGFVDEAGQITAKCRSVLVTRIRYRLDYYGLTPKLLMSCNPTKNWLYTEFYKPWEKTELESDKAFIQALAKDNPHNSEAYLNVLRRIKDKATRERLWFGNWHYEDDPTSLMTIDAITDLFTNTLEESHELYLTCDVARKGRDRAVIMIWRGLEVIHILVVDKSDPAFVKNPTQYQVDKVLELAEQFRVPRSHIVVDEGGVGGGVVDGLPGCKGFIGSAEAIQPYAAKWNKNLRVNYANLRAQCYYTLGDKVEAREMAISTDDTDYQQFITEELEQIKSKDADKDGKLKIIAKDEIKEHLGRSPDFADNLMMRMYFEVARPPTPGIG